MTISININQEGKINVGKFDWGISLLEMGEVGDHLFLV